MLARCPHIEINLDNIDSTKIDEYIPESQVLILFYAMM